MAELARIFAGSLLPAIAGGNFRVPRHSFPVPHGVEHRPNAPEEVALLLFEPATTINTGNVRNERTVEDLRRL